MHVAEQHVLRAELHGDPIFREDEFAASELTRTQAGDDTEAFLQVTAVRVNSRSKVLVDGDRCEGSAVDDEGGICLPHLRHLRRMPVWHVRLANTINLLKERHRLRESIRIAHAPATSPAVVMPLPSPPI